MKKTFIFAAFAALVSFASCQKEETPVPNQGEDLVFTATIESQDTKTAVDASAAKVSWVVGDKITINDTRASITAEYEVSAINDGCAFFTKVDGQPTLGTGPYFAAYGTDPSISQAYSATAPSLPMTASSRTTSLKFTTTCGLLELSLKAGEKVTSIKVTGTPTGGSETTYTLNCSSAVNIASGAKFFMALPAGNYTSFLINGQNGAQCKKSGSGVAIQTNHITPVSFSKALHFAVQLWAGGPYWATTNIGADKPEDNGLYFAWGYPEGQTPSGDSFSKAFTKENYPAVSGLSHLKGNNDMATVNWGSDWSMPTSEQLKTLVNNDSSNKCKVTYYSNSTDIWGVRITGLTEGYTSNSIFLPAANYVDGTNIQKFSGNSYCSYWSDLGAGLSATAFVLSAYPFSKSSRLAFANQYNGRPVRAVRSSL